MKSQDLQYVSMVKLMNERKLERLKAELPQSLATSESSEHFIFAEDEEEKNVILESRENETADEDKGKDKSEDEKAKKASKALREYQVRQERVKALTIAEKKLISQRHIMQPGRRKIIGTDEYGQPIFKWKAQRKK